MKSIFKPYAIAAVVVTVVACSGSDDGGQCAEPLIANGITGIASVEAGTLREERSGGEVFLLFEPRTAEPIAKAELAISVTYQIDSIEAATDKGWIWQPSLFRSAYALSCLPPSQLVKADIANIEISSLSSDSAPMVFEQGSSAAYIKPDDGLSTAGYLQSLADGPVEQSLVIDLRNSTVDNNASALFVSVTTDDGGVFMQSTGELVWSD